MSRNQLLTMVLSLDQYKKIRTPFVFFDETGSINDQANRFFGLGMIKCMQPYFLDQKIRLLRQRANFFEEIKWNTISNSKRKFLVKYIDVIFETPGIYFSSIIINKDSINFEKEFSNDPYQAYQRFAEDLLKKSIGQNEVLTVLADYISTPEYVRFEVKTKHSLNKDMDRLAIGGIHRVDSNGVQILQVADIFLGAVAYDYKLANQLVKGDRYKKDILHYILKKLDKKSFVGGIAARRFQVFEYQNKKGHHPIG